MGIPLHVKRLLRYGHKYGLAGIQLVNKAKRKPETPFQVSLKNYKFPITLRSGTSDNNVFNQVIYREEYNIKYKLDPKVIVDCGANIGLATVFYANKYPDATIIAIEPEAANFQLLKENTKHYKNVHCLQAGVWNKPTHLEIIDNNYGSWGFMIEERNESTNNTIKATTIDEILKQFNLEEIDILKMDIEGSEREVFEKDTENWLPKVKVIVIELHDGMRMGCSKSFFKSLEKFNYKIRPHRESLICYLSE